MQIKVIKLDKFKTENVRFSSPRANKHGGKVVYINYDYEDGNPPKPLRIQMPKMKAPFGISGWDKDRTDKSETSPTEQSNDTLELSIGQELSVVEKLEKLDDLIVQQAVTNSKEYFKKKYDNNYIKNIFKSPLKFSENEDGERDEKYPPRIKTKLYKDTDFSYKMQIFDSNKKPVKMSVYNYPEIMPKGSECVCLLECAGVWIINDKFGLSWKPAQMIVYKSDNNLGGYAFIDEEEDNQQEDNHQEDPLEKNKFQETPKETKEDLRQEDLPEENDNQEDLPEEDPLEQKVSKKTTPKKKVKA